MHPRRRPYKEGCMADRVVPVLGKWHKWDGEPKRKRISVVDWNGKPRHYITFKHFIAKEVDPSEEHYRSWYA